jgi:type IV pilus assembly protein PilW
MTRQNGVTLVELMISLVLGLLISIGMATLFSQNKRSFYQNEDLARMMEDGRYALEEVARDLAMAGFYAELASPSWVIDPNINGAANCRAANAVTVNPANPGLQISNVPFGISWTYAVFPRGTDLFRPEQAAIAVANNATAAQAAAEFPCLGGLANLEPGSDVFMIKRVAGASTPAVTANRVYIARRGPATGVLALGSTITASIPKVVGDPLENDWEYQPKVYYVRNITSDITGDGVAETIPTLCRMVMNPGPAFGEDCIAQGVERFQIEWGVDTTGDGDANAYVSALDAGMQNVAVADPNQVVTARIHMLMRSIRPDPTYTNPKTYQFADMPTLDPAADDRFYRRVLSTTVVVRNVQGMNLLSF